MPRGRAAAAAAATTLLTLAAAPAADARQEAASLVDGYFTTLNIDDRRGTLTVDEDRGVRTLTARGRKQTFRLPGVESGRQAFARARAAEAGGYPCVRNARRKGMTLFEPRYKTTKNDAYYIQFQFHLYRLANARRTNGGPNGGVLQKQYEMCVAGGGNARNGNRLRKILATMTMAAPSPELLGQKWGEGEKQREASATLGFQTSGKPVAINAAINVNPTAKITGSQGPDDLVPDDFEQYSHNQVNTYWDYGTSLSGRFGGSKHYQGNVGHALWEIPMGTRAPQIATGAVVNVSCARLLGNCGKE